MRFGTFSYNQSRPAVPEKQAFEELLEQILLTEKLGFIIPITACWRRRI
jgi:hypothetical protein